MKTSSKLLENNAMFELDNVLNSVTELKLFSWAENCVLLLEIDGFTFRFLDLSTISVNMTLQLVTVRATPEIESVPGKVVAQIFW